MALTDEQWEELYRSSAAAIGRALAKRGWPSVLDNGGLILPDPYLRQVQREAQEKERKRREQVQIDMIANMTMTEYVKQRERLFRASQALRPRRAPSPWDSWGNGINSNWKPVEVDEDGIPVEDDDIDESLICIWCGKVQASLDALDAHEDECSS